MDKATLERLRQFAGAISRATNSLIVRKAQDLQKHPGHDDQSVHDPRGGAGATGTASEQPRATVGASHPEVMGFKERYHKILSAKAGTGDYPAYTPEEVTRVVDRMTDAVARGSASFTSSPALRTVASQMGLKNFGELHSWMKERHTPTKKVVEAGDIEKHPGHE